MQGGDEDGGAGAPGAPASHSRDDADPGPDQDTSPYTDPDTGFGLLNMVTPPPSSSRAVPPS